MKTPFFITGLPRSRTAWLANLFTYGNSFCWHDACKGGLNADSVVEALSSVNTPYVGDSDSGLLLLYNAILARFPDSRWLLVRRHHVDAYKSFVKHFKERGYGGISVKDVQESVFEGLATNLQELSTALPAMQKLEVDFEDLESGLVLHRAWEFLTPGNSWNKARFDLLHGLEINVYPEKASIVWQ